MTTLYDEKGQTLGYFLTVAEYERLRELEAESRRLMYGWARAQFTDEEFDRAASETDEMTTKEVLDSMPNS